MIYLIHTLKDSTPIYMWDRWYVEGWLLPPLARERSMNPQAENKYPDGQYAGHVMTGQTAGYLTSRQRRVFRRGIHIEGFVFKRSVCVGFKSFYGAIRPMFQSVFNLFLWYRWLSFVKDLCKNLSVVIDFYVGLYLLCKRKELCLD
jgi:hypothetical protein